MLNLALIMGLALFLPAGTTHYPEAWRYLVIFFGGVLAISIYLVTKDRRLLQSRLAVGPTAEKRKAQKWIQGAASVGFIGVYILSGFDYRFHWSGVPKWFSVLSDVFIIVSMIFFFIVFKKNTYLSATVEVQEQQRVITGGPYAVVRHPMYTAALLLFLFTPFALNSCYALLTFPLMFLVLVFRCLDEEQALKKDLAGYEAYCQKVQYRLIPYIF